MTATALVGATGFVGGLLRSARRFDGEFHSRNVGELPDRTWDEVVCAGMPAEKWRANQDPDGDRAALGKLWSALERTRAGHVVLISTVDVYEPPVGKDEGDEADARHAYGRHRAELEQRVLDHFESAAVVRLPALHGPGLKKNALYDLLQGRPCPAPRGAAFQWYDLERLPADLSIVARHGLALAQLVTAPVTMGEIIDACFPGAEAPADDAPAPRYDLRTRHAAAFRGTDGYVCDHDTALAGIERFVARVRAGEVTCASP